MQAQNKILEDSRCALGRSELFVGMSDPRNVAHAKKVKQEKAHEHAATAAPTKANKKKSKAPPVEETPAAPAEPSPPPADLEKSVAVLSKLKDLEFHSRANIETLAQLTLTIEEELKQKEFSEPISALYSAQDNFQSKITSLIESYSLKCETMKQAG